MVGPAGFLSTESFVALQVPFKLATSAIRFVPFLPREPCPQSLQWLYAAIESHMSTGCRDSALETYISPGLGVLEPTLLLSPVTVLDKSSVGVWKVSLKKVDLFGCSSASQ